MRIYQLILFLLISTVSSALASEVTSSDSNITFDAPDGFTSLSAEEIKIKWPTASPPTFAVGNKTRSTSIAYDLKENLLHPDELEEAMSAFEQVFSRLVPGIDWKKREIIVLSGHRWILMEFVSNAVDAEIYNIMLVTSHKNQMLTLNLNSTSREFDGMEPVLRRSIRSIKLGER